MGKIVAIDYGTKRTGLAATDELKIIATALETVPTEQLLKYLKKYHAMYTIECFVVGYPKKLNNQPSDTVKFVDLLIRSLKKHFPSIPVETMDERFTSKIAFDTMIASGINRKARSDKSLVDKISATLILQSYMEMIQNRKV